MILDSSRAVIDVSFGLRVRHARRFVTLMVAIPRWRLWRLSIPCANFPRLGFVKIFHLSVALIVEWIKLREAAIGDVPMVLQRFFNMPPEADWTGA